jgi:hypothetical protein
MNEDEEVKRMYKILNNIKKTIEGIDENKLESMSIDNLIKCDKILGKMDKKLEDLQIDFQVTDFLINGSRMATCPEK